MPQVDSDTIDAIAFHAAHVAAPELDPDRLRLALDAYMAALHIGVSRVHADRELTPDEVLDVFRPRTVEG